MKKIRKQGVLVDGKMQLVDVPVDDELYKADNREEYLRVRSKNTQVSFETVIISGFADDVAEAYEESQLLENLQAALVALSVSDRKLIQYVFFDDMSETETAEKLNIARQTVNKKKHRIIKKLRDSLKNWQ
jgi:RNA polymerase sigma factor (sigma-70 family)